MIAAARLVRIRYYGFLAIRKRAQSIDQARQLIGGRFVPPVALRPTDDFRCPHCGEGMLRVIGPVPAERPPPSREGLP
jgi:hypothetical protein